MLNQIHTAIWMQVRKDTRDKLAQIFGIRQSSFGQVSNNEQVADGRTNEDLSIMTIEKLRDFVGTAAVDETIEDLFKSAVKRIENPPVTIAEVIKPEILEKLKSITSDAPIILKPEAIEPESNLFKCQICEKVFRAKIGLSGHMRSHNKKVK